MFELLEDRRPWYERHAFAFLFAVVFTVAALLHMLTGLLARRFPSLQPLAADLRFAVPIAGGALLAVLEVWSEEGPEGSHFTRLARVFAIVMAVCAALHAFARVYAITSPLMPWLDALVFAAVSEWEGRRVRRARAEAELSLGVSPSNDSRQ